MILLLSEWDTSEWSEHHILSQETCDFFHNWSEWQGGKYFNPIPLDHFYDNHNLWTISMIIIIYGSKVAIIDGGWWWNWYKKYNKSFLDDNNDAKYNWVDVIE